MSNNRINRYGRKRGRPRKEALSRHLAQIDAGQIDVFDEAAVNRFRKGSEADRAPYRHQIEVLAANVGATNIDGFHELLSPAEREHAAILAAFSDRDVGKLTSKDKAAILCDHLEQARYAAERNCCAEDWPDRLPPRKYAERPRFEEQLENLHILSLDGGVRQRNERERAALRDHRYLRAIVMHDLPCLGPDSIKQARKIFRQEKGGTPAPLSRTQYYDLEREKRRRRAFEIAEYEDLLHDLGDLPRMPPHEQGRAVDRARHRHKTWT